MDVLNTSDVLSNHLLNSFVLYSQTLFIQYFGRHVICMLNFQYVQLIIIYIRRNSFFKYFMYTYYLNFHSQFIYVKYLINCFIILISI